MKSLFALVVLLLATENSFATFTVTEYKSLLCIAVHSNAPLLPVFKFESTRVYNQVFEEQIALDSSAFAEVTTFRSDGLVTTKKLAVKKLSGETAIPFTNVDYQGLSGKSLSISYRFPEATATLNAAPSEIKQDFYLSDIPGEYLIVFSVDTKMTTTTGSGEKAQTFSGPVHCQGQMTIRGVLGGLSPFHNQN